MRLVPHGLEPDRALRKILPRSLFGRTLLIVVLPLILLEGVALQIFYGSHLDTLSRRLAGGVAGEIAFVLDQADAFPDARSQIFANAAYRFEFAFHFHPGRKLTPRRLPHVFGPVDTDLASALSVGLGRPFVLVWHGPPGMVRVDIQVSDGVLTIDVPRKRLYIGELYIFFAWLGGTTLILLSLAILFLRNQVRGIRRLALAAEAFGMGRDTGPIRPEGATEVRRAGAAFNRMQDRVRRFLAQRTAMLAGVSHDLRTPLTRLRLAIAMLPGETSDIDGMTSDIDEMERLIGLYLAFARGEGTEQAQVTDLAVLIEEITARAARGGAVIALNIAPLPSITLRPEAMRRALANLLDNAARHARRIEFAALPEGERSVRVLIDDDGPGIPAERREEVFRPFESGSAAGTGLGLAIARDIIAAHGGDIRLDDSPLGGLRVVVVLPV
ncbi:MAG: two-component sensor histidine kinase [Acidiphilium sp. 37-64-53]|uniref:ATP-binding protein n=1 Tax=Acidiphilium TaxID=522 RepID=UPI000BCF823F|nr:MULTISPECIES: ATP-binding protein [Acidiphilium]OYW03408.1 MAG: two-component sensor histidine kinase [Acidiphilium sp. 37-64-53]OZB30733.1 MAG: two-component sensor histidine kinase [Acidiphilium sp. 34-64-41]HQT84574.1 ATP-binding protein [Acidiphilium rubrum]